MTETAPAPPPPPELVSSRPAASPRLVLFGGLAAAALLGLVLALALSGDRDAKAGRDPETANGGLAIAVQPAPRPAPIPAAKSADPLNALPEEAAGLPANPRSPSAAPPPQVIPASNPPAARPAPRSRPSFDCDDAASRAEQMVCADDRLAAADRRMDRAYQAALDAGVPRRILRRQQRDFLDAREEAARHGPDAVADVYSERIAELDGMAQGY